MFKNLFLLAFLSSCGQTFNSHTNDVYLKAFSYCADTSQTALCEANEIIATKCANCHNYDGHKVWANYDTNAKWLATKFVVAGDPDNSSLVYRMKNYVGSASGPQDMPKGAGALTQEEFDKINSWVLSL